MPTSPSPSQSISEHRREEGRDALEKLLPLLDGTSDSDVFIQGDGDGDGDGDGWGGRGNQSDDTAAETE
jgi:hypothetical protein